MVAVVGNIQAKDDYTHPLGPESNFNESMYFNFFDRGKGLGGFLRVGNRANEGYAEATLCLFFPTGEVIFNYMRPQIDSNDAFDAGGIKFEVVEPLVKLRSTFEGGGVFLQHPEQMADPGQAFRENPHKRVSVDITHEAVGPVYGSTGAGRTEDPEKAFARAHYEQHMRTTGSITIDGERFAVDGTGLRDHSWGPRHWQAIHSYRWLTCAFDEGFSLMVSEIRPDADTRNQNGVVIRDGKLERITKIDLASEFVPNTPHHRSMKATLGLDSGEELQIEGAVKGFIPLRNRRAGMVTHIGEAMTEYRCAGRVGLGISEYLDQVE